MPDAKTVAGKADVDRLRDDPVLHGFLDCGNEIGHRRRDRSGYGLVARLLQQEASLIA